MTDSTRPQSPDPGASSAPGTHPAGPPPEQIGRYRILSELGRGGMGIVYEGEDPRLKRRIALKVLPDHLTRDPDALHRLEREAQLLAALNHPNVATIYSLEETDGRHFLTRRRRLVGLEVGDDFAFGDDVDGAIGWRLVAWRAGSSSTRLRRAAISVPCREAWITPAAATRDRAAEQPAYPR